MNDRPDPSSAAGEDAAWTGRAFAPWRFPGFLAMAGRSAGNLRTTVATTYARATGWWKHRRRSGRGSMGWGWLFLAVAALVVLSSLAFDERALADVNRLPLWLRWTAIYLTDAGSGVWYLAPAILMLLVANMTDWHSLSGRRLLLLYNRTTLAAFVVVAIGGAQLVASLVQSVVGRARPGYFAEHRPYAFDPFTLDEGWTSFPSGHATVAGAVAGVAMLAWPRLRWLVLPFGIMLALTRVIVRNHYPSDVVAGFALGLSFAVATAVVFSRLGYMFAPVDGGWPRPKTSFHLLGGNRRG